MAYVILDTDVSSQIFRDRLTPPLAGKLIGKTLCITFVTLAEMTQWAELRSWGTRNRQALKRWLEPVPVLPHDGGTGGTTLEHVATTWGEISAYAKRRGRPRPPNDTWIAACCLVYGLPLATLNAKDFADFVEHEGLELV